MGERGDVGARRLGRQRETSSIGVDLRDGPDHSAQRAPLGVVLEQEQGGARGIGSEHAGEQLRGPPQRVGVRGSPVQHRGRRRDGGCERPEQGSPVQRRHAVGGRPQSGRGLTGFGRGGCHARDVDRAVRAAQCPGRQQRGRVAERGDGGRQRVVDGRGGLRDRIQLRADPGQRPGGRPDRVVRERARRGGVGGGRAQTRDRTGGSRRSAAADATVVLGRAQVGDGGHPRTPIHTEQPAPRRRAASTAPTKTRDARPGRGEEDERITRTR